MTDSANKTDETPADKTAAPWGDDFDAARAWETITRQRDSEAALKKRIADFEKAEQDRADADKSELDKANARAERAEAAVKAAQRDALLAKSGLDEAFHGFITATDADGVAEQIAKLTAALGEKKPANEPDPKADDADTSNGRPKPGLTPGSGANDPEPLDLDAIAREARGL